MLASYFAEISDLHLDPADQLVQTRLRRLSVNEGLELQFTTANVILAVRNMGSSKVTGTNDATYAQLT